MKQVTESEEFRAAPFKIAVIHVPPIRDTWHGPLHTNKLFVPILNAAGIDLMLCGHLHRYFYVEAGEENCDFPVLINSNKEAVHIAADSKNMTLEIKDQSGKVTNKFSYQTKGK